MGYELAYETEDEIQEPEESGAKRPRKNNAQKLLEYANAVNLTDELEEDELMVLGGKVVEEYASDLDTMADWLKGYDEGLKLANLVAEKKTYPWDGAANIKFPLIANAAIKFNARAYPELVRNSEVVSFKTVGSDPQDAKNRRGMRVSKFMNWQLMEDMRDWDADMDRLTMMLPCVGQMYKKVFFDPNLGRNVSELINGNRLIINTHAPSWDRLRRKTYFYEIYHNEVIEKQRSGEFRECDLRADQSADQPHDQVYTFLEQHRYYDLDGDGYEEPYIVTADKESTKVLRIRAGYEPDGVIINQDDKVVKVIPEDYFEPYGFLPAFDGSLLSVGFGHLLYPLNEAANGIINRLLDAGTLNNLGGGFIGSGVRIKGGPMQFAPSEWKRIEVQGGDIGKQVFPLPTKEPSPVLFNLLSMIIESANDMAAVKDVLSGDMPSGVNAQPTTVLALIEQGQKTFNAIYKRIWRSLRGELRKLYRLNNRYLDPKQYLEVLDDEELQRNPLQAAKDFEGKDYDIIPVSDPNISSQAQRMAQTQAALQLTGRAGIDEYALTREAVASIGHPKLDELVPPKKPGQPDPGQAAAQAQAMMAQKDFELREREIAVKEKEASMKAVESAAKALETEAKIKDLLAAAIKKMAEAEAAEAGTQLEAYRVALEELYRQSEPSNADNQTAVRRVAAAPDNSPRPPAIPAGSGPVEAPADIGSALLSPGPGGGLGQADGAMQLPIGMDSGGLGVPDSGV